MLIRKIFFPVLTAAVLAGCQTPSLFSSKTDAEKNGTQRMMSLAQKLESQGQDQVAMRLYQEILAKQPSHKPAMQNYVRLKDRLSTPASGAPQTMLAQQPKSIEAIEQLVAAEVAKQMAKKNGETTNPFGQTPSNAMLTSKDKVIEVTPASVSNVDPVALQMMGLSTEAVQQRVEAKPVAVAESDVVPFGSDPAFCSDDNCQTAPEIASGPVVDPFMNEAAPTVSQPAPANAALNAFAEQSVAEQAPQVAATPTDASNMDAAFANAVPETTSSFAATPAADDAFSQPSAMELAQAAAAIPTTIAEPAAEPIAEPASEEALLEQLKESDESRQVDALIKLADVGSNTDATLEKIGDAAFDGSDVVQVHAAWALGKITNQPVISAEDISDFLTSEQLPAVQSAAYLLGLLEDHAQPYLKDLEGQLNHSDELTRLHVAEALVKLSPDHPQGVATILDLASSDDNSIRCLATHVISELDPEKHPQTLTSLSMKLNDNDPTIRTAAALALGGFGIKAEPVIPALLVSTSDQDNDVRLAANTALSCIMDEVARD
jgi:hypothetical protein